MFWCSGVFKMMFSGPIVAAAVALAPSPDAPVTGVDHCVPDVVVCIEFSIPALPVSMLGCPLSTRVSTSMSRLVDTILLVHHSSCGLGLRLRMSYTHIIVDSLDEEPTDDEQYRQGRGKFPVAHTCSASICSKGRLFPCIVVGLARISSRSLNNGAKEKFRSPPSAFSLTVPAAAHPDRRPGYDSDPCEMVSLPPRGGKNSSDRRRDLDDNDGAPRKVRLSPITPDICKCVVSLFCARTGPTSFHHLPGGAATGIPFRAHSFVTFVSCIPDRGDALRVVVSGLRTKRGSSVWPRLAMTVTEFCGQIYPGAVLLTSLTAEPPSIQGGRPAAGCLVVDEVVGPTSPCVRSHSLDP